MIHAAICDDEKSFVKHMTQLLQRYAEEIREEIRITTFFDGLDLIERYDPSFDLIFLDIQMNLMDGLDAAGKIRERDKKVAIIFLTTMVQYGLEGYKYQATNYIIKPMQYVRLKAEMDRFRSQRRKEESPSLVVANEDGKCRVFLDAIQYIETEKRNLLLHTEKENILCYKSMKEMEQELQDKGFARSHTSYLVNLDFVKGVKKLELQMRSGEVLPISHPGGKSLWNT